MIPVMLLEKLFQQLILSWANHLISLGQGFFIFKVKILTKFFCSFFVSLSFHRTEKSGNLLWITFWLNGMLWLVQSPTPTPKIFSISAIRLLYFLIIHMFTRVALLSFFKNFSFTFTAWLTGSRGLAFDLSWLSTCLHHLSLITSNF